MTSRGRSGGLRPVRSARGCEFMGHEVLQAAANAALTLGRTLDHRDSVYRLPGQAQSAPASDCAGLRNAIAASEIQRRRLDAESSTSGASRKPAHTSEEIVCDLVADTSAREITDAAKQRSFSPFRLSGWRFLWKGLSNRSVRRSSGSCAVKLRWESCPRIFGKTEAAGNPSLRRGSRGPSRLGYGDLWPDQS
jgi:hypothetical protein